MYPEAGADLIGRARTDRNAFGEIYDLYVRRVYAFCLSKSGHQNRRRRFDLPDLRACPGCIPRYDHRGAPLSAWFLRIAANLVTDRGQQSGRLVFLGDDPLPEKNLDRPGEPNPQDVVEQWERAVWMRQHLAALPEDQRRALQLRYWEGHAVAEIAKQLNRNENATKQLLHRAVTTLRGRLGREVNGNV